MALQQCPEALEDLEVICKSKPQERGVSQLGACGLFRGVSVNCGAAEVGKGTMSFMGASELQQGVRDTVPSCFSF